MNERIKELSKEAVLTASTTYANGPDAIWLKEYNKKFAELIVAECKEKFSKVWYEQGMDLRGAELGKFLTRFDEYIGVEE